MENRIGDARVAGQVRKGAEVSAPRGASAPSPATLSKLGNVLAGPAVVVSSADLVDAYFEPLRNTAKNLGPSEKARELRRRREEEELKDEQEQEVRDREDLEKEQDAARVAAEAGKFV